MPVKLQDINPMSNADTLLTIEGLKGYWTTFSGIKKKYKRPKYSDGLSALNRTAASGSSEYEDVTIGKPYDPEKDDATIDFLKEKEAGDAFDFSLRPVKRNKGLEFRGNKAWHLSGCRVSEWSILEDVDTGDGEKVAMIKIVFSLEDASWSGAGKDFSTVA
jgi:hypothetical protein